MSYFPYVVELFIRQQQFECDRGQDVEGVLRTLQHEVLRRNPLVAIVEGSPLYANPYEEYPDQSMDHPAARTAMFMTERVLSLLRSQGISTQHWLLLDDVNNGADLRTQQDIWQQFLEQSNYIPLYRDVQRIQFESDYRYSPDDTCAMMDASFQREKIHQATHEFGSLDRLPLFINIHPTSFQSQQRMMLERLRSILKNDAFANTLHVGKKVKNSLSLDTFMHIWTDGTGTIELTRPVINGGGVLEHQPIPIQQ